MRRIAQIFSCLAFLAFGGQLAFGYALLGPAANGADTWQVADIGYMLAGRDIGAPKNLGEEYRWNTPVIYYSFDQNFLDYFGSNGVAAVEGAIAILNGLTNFSQYSADLSEVPLSTTRINYRAQALHLIDLKSFALHFIVEELGLTEPDRYTWTLRTRETQPGLSCPFMIYRVIQRNWDPLTAQPSSYVNGTLYSYFIDELCTGGPPVATTVPFAVDPLVFNTFAVMSQDSYGSYGSYMTSMTRDDVGGLRYLYGTNNVNWEAMSTDSTLFATNTSGGPQLLITSNLNMLAAQALTNAPGALQALYPGLSIVSTTTIYTNVWVTNVTAYFVNNPLDPIGTPPHLAFTTTRTLTVQTLYHHIFGNVVTFNSVNGVWTVVPVPDPSLHTGPVLYSVQTTSATTSPIAPPGSPPTTNFTSVLYATNDVAGDFFILSSNLCGIAIAGFQANLPTSSTNVVVSSTNQLSTTNAQFYTQSIVTYGTNRVFTYFPVECLATNTALRQGIDKLTFVRANYDSLVGRFFQPITNNYTQVIVTNSQAIRATLQRVVAKPDFLFSAVDMAEFSIDRSTTVGNFNDANENPGLSGPGNIEPNMQMRYNKVGPLIVNTYNTNTIGNGLSQASSRTNFIWGSYDGSTNAPIAYPNGTSIASLEAQILFQITTALLPGGNVATNYPPTQLQSAGGLPPFTWSLASGSTALPPGLSLSASGIISGRPTTVGTYNFTVSLAGTIPGGYQRTITRPLSITISP